MATFSELYGDLLDIELGTSDRSQRFTIARRKAAINRAQQEFVRMTGCVTAEASWTLADQDDELNLVTITTGTGKFMRFATQQPWIEKTDINGKKTYIMGKDFLQKDIETLDREDPGWRNASAGVPRNWYHREDDATHWFGLYPPVDVATGDIWVLHIPFVSYADTLVGDSEIPLNAKTSLEVYHQALVHYAAAQLEKLRRNYQVSSAQLDAFISYTQEYLGQQKQTGGDRVEFASNYFESAHQGMAGVYAPDPFRDDM